jgi:glucosamine-6-phosphate deaminase
MKGMTEAEKPNYAITCGVKTIMQARKIFIVAFSEEKAKIVQKAVETDISDQIPATFLQNHSNCLFVLDEAAASNLTRFQKPWTVKGPSGGFITEYDLFTTKKAVAWLSELYQKPILSLEENEYRESGLLDILVQNNLPAPELNFRIRLTISPLKKFQVRISAENHLLAREGCPRGMDESANERPDRN